MQDFRTAVPALAGQSLSARGNRVRLFLYGQQKGVDVFRAGLRESSYFESRNILIAVP
jgi:hypothetical protein